LKVNAKKIFQCRAGSAKLIQWATILLAIMFMTNSLAFAGLGEDASSVQADWVRMQGSVRTTQTQAYTVHEIQTATGTVVREYVSPSGKVFGVAWQGPWPPNMRQILATYFEQYQRAAQAQANLRVGRRPLLIEQPGLVVQSGGHMRSFGGRAYIPDMLPQEVGAEAIR
jgi:preprotein translocase subunit SecG